LPYLRLQLISSHINTILTGILSYLKAFPTPYPLSPPHLPKPRNLPPAHRRHHRTQRPSRHQRRPRKIQRRPLINQRMRRLSLRHTRLNRLVVQRRARKRVHLLDQLVIDGHDEGDGEGHDAGEEEAGGEVELEGTGGGVFCGGLVCVWMGEGGGRGTLGCYVGGGEGAGDGEGDAHGAAEGEDFVPLLCGEGGGRFHYCWHGYEGQTGILACMTCQSSIGN
jgi:hypothetical protein